MSIVLAWQSRARDAPRPSASSIACRLVSRRCSRAPAGTPARSRRRARGAPRPPSRRLDLPRFERDTARAERWALARRFPVDVGALPRAGGAEPADGPLLNAACALDTEPLGTLRPAGAAVFAALERRARRVALDPERRPRMAQLFELDTPRLWAVTNRPTALAALGVELDPVPEEWALWASLDWAPARHLRLSRPAPRRARHPLRGAPRWRRAHTLRRPSRLGRAAAVAAHRRARARAPRAGAPARARSAVLGAP